MTVRLTHRLSVRTGGCFRCHDITPELQALVAQADLANGLLVAAGQHTTTALVVNENEERLLADIEAFFLQLAPADRPWLHNDLHLRPGIPPDEPRNAHSHLIALMLGNHADRRTPAGRCLGGRGWKRRRQSQAAGDGHGTDPKSLRLLLDRQSRALSKQLHEPSTAASSQPGRNGRCRHAWVFMSRQIWCFAEQLQCSQSLEALRESTKVPCLCGQFLGLENNRLLSLMGAHHYSLDDGFSSGFGVSLSNLWHSPGSAWPGRDAGCRSDHAISSGSSAVCLRSSRSIICQCCIPSQGE